MKHWTEGPTNTSYDPIALNLAIGSDGDRIVSIAFKPETGMFEIVEQCDGFFGEACTREVLLEALQEAADWVRGI